MICPLRSCSDPGHARDQNSRDGSVSCGLLFGHNDYALGVVIGQSMRSPEHGQGAVRIGMDLDRCLGEVPAQPAWRQLQAQPLPIHRVVIADGAIFLDIPQLLENPNKSLANRLYRNSSRFHDPRRLP